MAWPEAKKYKKSFCWTQKMFHCSALSAQWRVCRVYAKFKQTFRPAPTMAWPGAKNAKRSVAQNATRDNTVEGEREEWFDSNYRRWKLVDTRPCKEGRQSQLKSGGSYGWNKLIVQLKSEGFCGWGDLIATVVVFEMWGISGQILCCNPFCEQIRIRPRLVSLMLR